MPDRYALFGHPVAHSVSPQLHIAFARQTRQDLLYEKREIAPDGFAAAVSEFFATGGKGLNVTLPFKRVAFDCAVCTTARARAAGAVNTLWRDSTGTVHGDNTDGAGFIRDLTRNCAIRVAGRRVLLLGAGGAVRGIIGPLLEQQPAGVHIANRTVARAEALAEAHPRANVTAGGLDTLPPLAFDLIVDATAAGHDAAAPPLPDACLARGGACYALSYGAAAAPFLAWARAHGAGRVSDGWGMLVEQAAESFCLWRGVRPETARILASRDSFLCPLP